MNLLSVLPEGIQIEEGANLAHIGTNGHTRGGWSLNAPLNPALLDPLDAPTIQAKGCHVGRDGNLQGLRDGEEKSLLCLHTPSAGGVEDSGSTFSGSCGGGLDMVVGGLSTPFGRRLGH